MHSGRHAGRPAKENRARLVGELSDNGSSPSGSGAIRAGARRWRARSARASAYSSKDVRAVVIGSDVACGAEARPNFWFRRCSALTRVDGMNALWGVVQIQYTSISYTAFEPIGLRGLKASA